MRYVPTGPPGQMKAISGMKAGMKQGELGGALKDAGFREDQVRMNHHYPVVDDFGILTNSHIVGL
jgi:hypothetical protein